MARREIVQFFDDFDNTPLKDNEVSIIKFSFDGANYVIDLSAKNAEKFRSAMAPYIEVARKESAAPRQRRSASSASETRKIREWARSQNIAVKDRGKLPDTIIEAYRKAIK